MPIKKVRQLRIQKHSTRAVAGKAREFGTHKKAAENAIMADIKTLLATETPDGVITFYCSQPDILEHLKYLKHVIVDDAAGVADPNNPMRYLRFFNKNNALPFFNNRKKNLTYAHPLKNVSKSSTAGVRTASRRERREFIEDRHGSGVEFNSSSNSSTPISSPYSSRSSSFDIVSFTQEACENLRKLTLSPPTREVIVF